MRDVVLVAGIVLMVGLLAAVQFREPMPASRLRLAGVATPVTAMVRWGIDQGLFAAEGLEVDFSEQSESGDVDQIWGGVDAVIGDLETTLRLQDRSDRPVRVALVLAVSQGAHVMQARAGIDQIDGIKGHRIGMAAGAVGEWMLQQALASAGLARADVTVVPVASGQVAVSLATHQIDAVVAPAWALADWSAAGAANRLFDSAHIPGCLAEVLLVDQTFLKQRPMTVAALRRAWTATACAWLQRGDSSTGGLSLPRPAVREPLQWLDRTSGFRLIPDEAQGEVLGSDRLRVSLDKIQRLMHSTGWIGFGRPDACLDGLGGGGGK